MLSGSLSPRCAAQSNYGSNPSKPSFTDSIKNSFNKMGEAISPKQKTNALPSDDPTLLNTKNKPSAELYLSIAKLQADTNQPAQAEAQYRQILKSFPNHLEAMLSYAHFLENQERYDEAVSLYQRAIKTHPKEPSPYNNLGMCHARKKKLKEATASLEQAIQLDPRNPLYRNNIAALLVEQNRLSDAFEQLRSVHGDAKAYYNLGYMLNKKGDSDAAEYHFKRALMADPTFESAQRWLSYLQSRPHAAQASTIDRNFKTIRSNPPPANNPPEEHVASRLTPPSEPAAPSTPAPRQNSLDMPRHLPAPKSVFPQEPPLPDSAFPKRLPPVVVRQPVSPSTPDDSTDAPDNSNVAPLPPGMSYP
jgi:Tfp pilus assembly protein PilF